MQGIRVLDGRFRRHPGWTVIGLVALGDRTRAARDRAAQLQERTRELEREREERTRLAVSAERSRTARELHDVAAHGIAVIAVQAAGARRVLHPDPQRAAEALREIEDTARGGLTELRQAVSLLREGAPDAMLSPAITRRLLDEFARRDVARPPPALPRTC